MAEDTPASAPTRSLGRALLDQAANDWAICAADYWTNAPARQAGQSMQPSDAKEQPRSRARRARDRLTTVPWRLHVLIGIIGAITVAMIGHGFNTGQRMVAKYSTLVDACVQARLEATCARLQLDGTIAGDPKASVDTFHKHIEQAEAFARTVARGVNADAGQTKSDYRTLRNARGMLTHLSRMRNSGERVLRDRFAGQLNPTSTERTDLEFINVVKHSEWAKERLERLRSLDMQAFQFTQIYLLISCVLMTSIAGAAFHRFERTRSAAHDDTKRANASLRAEIEHRERVEKDLRKSQHLVSRTVSRLRDAILIIDSDTGLILDCNPACAEMFGRSREDLMGASAATLHVDAESAATFESLRDRAVGEWGFLVLPSFEMKRGDGDTFIAEHTAVPLEDDQGERVGWVSVVRDITARVEAEEEHAVLQHQLHRWEQSQAVSKLAGEVAREFDKLFASISQNLEQVQRRLADEHEALHPLAGAQQSLEQAAGVTESLRDLSRRGPIERTPTGLAQATPASSVREL